MVLLLITLAALAGLSSPPARAQRLASGVLGNGGDRAAGGGVAVKGTLGQAVVGASQGGALKLCHGFWCSSVARLVDVPLIPSGGPHDRPDLGPPSPNPSAGGTAFSIVLPVAAEVRLSVYDLLGGHRRTVYAGRLGAGVHHLYWDGTGTAGDREGSGMYFARLLVDGRWAGQRRLVLLR
jgi:hypothetical protein